MMMETQRRTRQIDNHGARKDGTKEAQRLWVLGEAWARLPGGGDVMQHILFGT